MIAVAAAVFGPYATHAGSHLDDWILAEHHLFPRLQLPPDALSVRGPLLRPLINLPFALGMTDGVRMTWGLLLGCISATSAFVLIRTLNFERLMALVVALLVLLFPLADSVRLISTWSADTVAVTLYLVGASVAISGLPLQGLRAARRHALALALYMVSILTYDVTASAVAGSGLLYWLCASWGRAWRRWLADGLALALSVLLLAWTTPYAFPLQSVGGTLRHAVEVVVQGLGVIVVTMFPPGSDVLTARRVAVSLALTSLTLLCLAIWARRATRARGALFGLELRRWSRIAAACVAAVGVAYLVLVPAINYYHPLARGEANRVNMLAVVAATTFVYAIVRVAALLSVKRMARVPIVAAAGCILLGAAYVPTLIADEHRWDRATALETAILRAAGAATARHRTAHNVLYIVGARAQVAPGVLLFPDDEYLNAALRIGLHTAAVRGYGLKSWNDLVCGAQGVHGGPPGGHPAPYGRVLVVTAQPSGSWVISDRGQCASLRSRLRS